MEAKVHWYFKISLIHTLNILQIPCIRQEETFESYFSWEIVGQYVHIQEYVLEATRVWQQQNSFRSNTYFMCRAPIIVTDIFSEFPHCSKIYFHIRFYNFHIFISDFMASSFWSLGLWVWIKDDKRANLHSFTTTPRATNASHWHY